MAGPIAGLPEPLSVDLRPGIGLIISRFPRIADAPADFHLGEFEGRPCLFLRDQYLSHPHAVLELDRDGQPHIRLATDRVRNPIWVNQPQPGPDSGVREAPLAVGDQVQVGLSVFRFEPASRWHALFGSLYPEHVYLGGSPLDAKGYATHELGAPDGEVCVAEFQQFEAQEPGVQEIVAQLVQRLQGLQRKQREMKQLAAVTPAIHDVKVLQAERMWHVVMLRERVEPASLTEQVLELHTPMLTGTALRFGMALCSAVHAFNRYGVHRNLLPSCVHFQQGDEPKEDRVILGGLFAAKPQAGGATLAQLAINEESMYRPPEQIEHGEYNERSDQYGVALLVGTALCGQFPFEAKNVVELTTKIQHAQPRLPEDLSPRIKAVLQRAWAKKPSQRFPLVLDLRVQLQRLLTSEVAG